MELADLIAAVKAAKSKDDLEALVKAELGLDIDKRKTLKALRGEALLGLGVTDDAGEADDDSGEQSEVATASILADEDSAPPLSPPPLDKASAPAIEPHTGNRLLRNKKTGRTFVWTPALARLADLEEV